jgi:hypothetical protein
MDRIVAVMMLGALAVVQMPVAHAQSGQIAGPQSELRSNSASSDVPSLPPAPQGKSTILGGEIRSVDPVRDELTLKVYGQRPTKILFDERTQVYRDGKPIALHDLGSADHASVQTVLDKTSVYALSIHILSQSPEGEYQGRVLSYNTDTRVLTVSSAQFGDPIKILVPTNTLVARVGQPEFSSGLPESSDLVSGALISVKFESDKKGRGVASQIAVLARPGSSFEFVGDITALDTHSGILVLVDPVDEKSYQISFDSTRLPASQNLHPGDRVSVSAIYDGSRYTASAVTAK